VVGAEQPPLCAPALGGVAKLGHNRQAKLEASRRSSSIRPLRRRPWASTRIAPISETKRP